MIDVLIWLQNAPPAVMLRAAPWLGVAVTGVHFVALSFVVISLAVRGRAPLSLLTVALVSGALLFAGDAFRQASNPLAVADGMILVGTWLTSAVSQSSRRRSLGRP